MRLNGINQILIGYKLFSDISINAQFGYRLFGGNKLEPPEDLDFVPIDFDYNGTFFNVGMSYGFGIR